MPPTLAERLAEAADLLAGVTETPRFEAELLLAHALGMSRGKLLASLRTAPEVDGYERLLARRLAHEPVAYILGEWEFYSQPVYVERPILVPRPETEHLVEAVLDFVKRRPARILELCAGTGCVAVAVAVHAPQAQILATDINPRAVALARRNVERHGLHARIALGEGDLWDALPPGEAPFDVVCANPPYVEEKDWAGLAPDIRLFEDPGALLAGEDGLAVIRRIAEGAIAHLRTGGLLALEVGMGQYDAVGALLRRCGYVEVGARPDLAGIERVVTACKPPRVEG